MVHFTDMSNNQLIASMNTPDGMITGSGSTKTLAVCTAGGNYCG